MAALMLDLTITRDQIARQEMFKDLFINNPARMVEPFLCVTNFRFVARFRLAYMYNISIEIEIECLALKG